MARCRYCLTECRTEYNIATRTCSKCQNNTKRQMRYLSVRRDLVEKTPKVKPVVKPVSSIGNVSSVREPWEEKLNQLKLKTEQTRIELDEAIESIDKFLDGLTNHKY